MKILRVIGFSAAALLCAVFMTVSVCSADFSYDLLINMSDDYQTPVTVHTDNLETCDLIIEPHFVTTTEVSEDTVTGGTNDSESVSESKKQNSAKTKSEKVFNVSTVILAVIAVIVIAIIIIAIVKLDKKKHPWGHNWNNWR